MPMTAPNLMMTGLQIAGAHPAPIKHPYYASHRSLGKQPISIKD